MQQYTPDRHIRLSCHLVLRNRDLIRIAARHGRLQALGEKWDASKRASMLPNGRQQAARMLVLK